MTNPFLNPAPATPATPASPFGNPAPFPGMVTPQVHAPAPAAAPPALSFGSLRPVGAPIIGEGGGAKLINMYGRLVLWFPLALDRVPQFRDDNKAPTGDGMRDQITVTAVVLDDARGGQSPITWGGSLMPPVADTESAPLPYVRKGMRIPQKGLISQLRAGVPAERGGQPEMLAGRVAKDGPANTDPWYLIGATEAEVLLVNQYLEAVKAGAFPHPLA